MLDTANKSDGAELRRMEGMTELEKDARRYQVVRRLEPRMFKEVWRINIAFGIRFDDIIDRIMDGRSYFDDKMMQNLEYALSPEGEFYRSRVVWAGDYAEKEKGQCMNLYELCEEKQEERMELKCKYRIYCQYIVNHTKKQYVDKQHLKGDVSIHPLPLLVSDGNGAGGGDYRGSKEYMCGDWARDEISLEQDKPVGYEELECAFEE
jgi:hypothetical protein